VDLDVIKQKGKRGVLSSRMKHCKDVHIQVMWIVPRFLLSWRRDVRPHVVLKSDLVEQLVNFCFGDGLILPSLREDFNTNGKVCMPLEHPILKGTFIFNQLITKDSMVGESDMEEDILSQAASQRSREAVRPRVFFGPRVGRHLFLVC
jgi:hypothetical protein